LTPTRRLAHQLRVDHDAAAAASGRAVWRTLEVLPWQTWIEAQCQVERQAGVLRGRLLRSEAAALVWQRIVADDPGDAGVVSPAGLARAAYRSWRSMQTYCIPATALDEEATLETRSFARWVRRYTAWLTEHRAIDPDLAAAALSPGLVARPLRLEGFEELTPLQTRLIERLRAGGVEIAIEPLPQRRGALSRVECRDAAAEFDAAARWAAAWLDRDPAARLGIVVPDLEQRRAQVRRAIERVLLPAAGFTGGPLPESRAFEIAEAPPLAERAIVVAALDLLRALHSGADAATGGRLLRNPWLRGAAAEGTERAMLDVWLRRHVAGEVSLARLSGLAARHGCPVLAQTLLAGVALARGETGRALPSVWSSRFFDRLVALGWPGEGLTSFEHQTAERLRELIAGLAFADEITGPLDASDALALLRQQAEGVDFEPQEIEAPLLVIDPATSAGMSFDGLWLTGMEAADWPSAAAPDPFLPRAWQIRAGMPGSSPELAYERARRRFARLVQSADETVASVARFDDDAPVLASALLTGVARRDVAPAWSHPSLAAGIHAARPTLEVAVDARLPPPRTRPARGGARLLELQSACPFRAGAEYRLHARALEDPDPGLSPAERGKLVHGVLARLWQMLRDQAGLAALHPTALDDAVVAVIASELAHLRRGASQLRAQLLDVEAQWLRERLHELFDAERARRPFAVLDLEAERSVALGALALSIKVDRVDRLEDGSLAIIDYKTGRDASTGGWFGDRPRQPQLPLYLQAFGGKDVAALAYARVRTGESGYVGLARDVQAFGGIGTVGGDGPRGFDSWEQLLAFWRTRLSALADEYLSGDMRLAPDPAVACRHCHLATLCRIDDTALRWARPERSDD
jgi:probable DNA repair protein